MYLSRRRRGRLLALTQSLEKEALVDRMTPAVEMLARPFNSQAVVDVLRGSWLGHALHPLTTDFPLGCWIGAAVLDVIPGSEDAARSLVGAGLLAVPLTLAAGLAEFGSLSTVQQRRVATVHALGNVLAGLAYTRSWMARRRGRRGSGVAWSLFGGGLALATGYLGGHMSFVLKAGTGPR